MRCTLYLEDPLHILLTVEIPIYHLHGALHLFSDGLKEFKAICNHSGSLIEIIDRETHPPLFISEGDTKKKKDKIKKSQYLSFCFKELKKSSSENFIIFGHSLNEQDKHIINAIKQSKNLAISIYEEDENLLKKIKQIKKENENLKIALFDAKTHPLYKNK